MLWTVHCRSGKEANGGPSSPSVMIPAHTSTHSILPAAFPRAPMVGDAIAGMAQVIFATWLSLAFGSQMVVPLVARNAPPYPQIPAQHVCAVTNA